MAGIGNGNELFLDETLGFLYTKPEYSHKNKFSHWANTCC